MKKRILIALVVVLALAANASVVWGMPHLTVGNDALPRLGPDGRSGCVTIDTNNPASGSGWLHTFTYWASTANPFRFVLVDGSWEVKWVSDEITPSMVPEVNTYYAPAMSVPVEADWNLGVYSPGTGTVPYDYTGAPVCQTKGGLGVPTVGEYLDCQNYGASYYNRTYSFGASDTLQVAIDIKPGSDPNTINLGSKGVIPVAILSSLDFDATEVNAETVLLGGAGVTIRGKGSRLAHEEDVNADGLLDLVVQVETESLDPGQFQDGYAMLTAQTSWGFPIEGQDEILIVPQ